MRGKDESERKGENGERLVEEEEKVEEAKERGGKGLGKEEITGKRMRTKMKK